MDVKRPNEDGIPTRPFVPLTVNYESEDLNCIALAPLMSLSIVAGCGFIIGLSSAFISLPDIKGKKFELEKSEFLI
jgi:hypothetical protein